MSIESFWEYSCRIYSLASVREACLQLQDEHDLDVNMLLLCCWHGTTRGEFAERFLAQALSLSQTWSANVVSPLRGARRWMKAQLAQDSPQKALVSESFISLREDIKALELRCEQHQQSFLQATCTTEPVALKHAQQVAAIAYNFQRLLVAIQQNKNVQLISAIKHFIVLITAHPTSSKDEALAIFQKVWA